MIKDDFSLRGKIAIGVIVAGLIILWSFPIRWFFLATASILGAQWAPQTGMPALIAEKINDFRRVQTNASLYTVGDDEFVIHNILWQSFEDHWRFSIQPEVSSLSIDATLQNAAEHCNAVIGQLPGVPQGLIDTSFVYRIDFEWVSDGSLDVEYGQPIGITHSFRIRDGLCRDSVRSGDKAVATYFGDLDGWFVSSILQSPFEDKFVRIAEFTRLNGPNSAENVFDPEKACLLVLSEVGVFNIFAQLPNLNPPQDINKKWLMITRSPAGTDFPNRKTYIYQIDGRDSCSLYSEVDQ